MASSQITFDQSGLEVVNLRDHEGFATRRPRARDPVAGMLALQQLARAFVDAPETLLQVLVGRAVDLCGADSAGISIETGDPDPRFAFRWVATAGQYAGFFNATLPSELSACGLRLERDQPQHFRVSQRFFDPTGILAPVVTDGILLPWQGEDTRGTLWIMAHDRTEAFDTEDAQLVAILADFAAMASRHGRQGRDLLQQGNASAAAGMANDLAHQINNPLQSLTNLVYLAAEGGSGQDAKALAQQLAGDLLRLSTLVQKLLGVPGILLRDLKRRASTTP